MIGKELAVLRSIDAERHNSRIDRTEAPVLAATGLGRKGAIAPTDFDVYRGEVVGFAGLLGSGRTELARLLFGADRADSGTVEFEGRPVALHSPAAGLSRRIAYSSENRRDEGIIADLTVRENLVLAVQARRGWMRPLSKREQNEIVDKYVAELGIRPANPEMPVKNLSGGNQQKVLLGRWLATRPDMLILDEPTRGIDIGAKAEIQATVVALSDAGVSVVYISSEIDEVVRLSDRIAILKDRRKIDEIDVGPSTSTATVVGIIAGEGAT
jgi:simple sugar transport system ATP-binding protein